MGRRLHRNVVLFFMLSCVSAFCQSNTTVRIGVAALRSGTDRVSITKARDRLVKALDHQKLGKKGEITIQAIALDEAKGPPAFAEAKSKNCQWVVFTHLTDLKTTERGQSANFSLGGVTQIPVITARVAYQIARAIDGAEIAIGFATGEDTTSTPDAVFQAMAHIGGQVAGEIKKGGNVPHRELAPDELAGAGAAPKSFEMESIGADYCKWLPSNVAHAEMLRGACEYAMSLPEKMPNFICDQETFRYRGQNQVARDLITAIVRYEDGNESYSEIKLNGQPAPSAVTESPGLWSTGQFGSNLRAVFDLRNKPLFEFDGENKLGERAAWVFSYQIVHQNDPLWRLRTEDEMIAPPYHGELWVDQKSGALLRFQAIAKDIPTSFPTQSAELMTDYNTVAFADGTSFLLPATAVVATQFRGEEATRNVLQFKNCHRFRAKSRMLLDMANVAGGSAPDAAANAAAESEREENESIYAILREQAVRDDSVLLESESRQIQQSNSIRTFARMQNIDKIVEHYRAQQELAQKQAEAASNSATVLKVRVNLVQVDTVVKDANAEAVGGLQKEDFQLFENGKALEITRFSEEQGAGPQAAPSAPEQATPTVQPSAPPTNSEAPRYVAYIFDDIHSRFEDLRAATKAASQHLASSPEGEKAAIFVTSGQGGTDFTSDHAKLEEALSKVKPRWNEGYQCPHMDPYMADLIVNQGDREALSVATDDAERCAYGTSQKNDPNLMQRSESLARSTAMQVFSEASSTTQATLSVIREVSRRLASMPGRRSIILISPGFLTLTPETRQAIMGLIDNALALNIVVHTLADQGLTVPLPDAKLEHSSEPVVQSRIDREGTGSKGEVLADLAYSTGGTYFHNNNDMNEGFRRTDEVPKYMYVLGFSPPKLDGKYHKLKVTLRASAATGHGKLTVQARQGYYALRAQAQN